MGRTNGRLVPFLKEALLSAKYINLKKDMLEAPGAFLINIPRFHRNIGQEFEKILKDWFYVNGKPYKGYSNAKSVIKAALKKSIFLVFLRKEGSVIFYRFATLEETREKKQRQKESSQRSRLCDSPLSSVSSSSQSDNYTDESFSDFEPCKSPGPVNQLSSLIESCDINPTLNFADPQGLEDYSAYAQNQTLEEIYPSLAISGDLLEEPMGMQSDSSSLMNNNVDLVNYITNEKIEENALSSFLDKDSGNSSTVYHADVSQNTQQPLETKTDHVKEEIITGPTTVTSGIELFMRKTVWVFTEKKMVQTFIIYVCEPKVVESSDVNEITSYPDVIIPPDLMEEGKSLRCQIPLENSLWVIYG